jgi:pyrimidine-nucleoside phosphorylase/thymidine phosphorylase
MAECFATLRGEGPDDLTTLSVELAARMVEAAGLETSLEEARTRVGAALDDGRGLETLRETIEAQGGDPRVVDAPARMPSVPTVDRVPAPRSGYLAALDAELVGRAAVVLGAGRDQVDHAVDHAVGVVVRVGMGEPVTAGDPVVELHHRETRGLDAARELVTRAVRIDDVAPPPPPRILETVA